MKNKTANQIKIGDIKIGGGAPVSVQSMTNTDTRNIDATVAQIKELEQAKCDIVRLAVVDEQAACAIKHIKKRVDIPLVADIHFDYRLALKSIDSGIDALRLNPGNIGKIDFVKQVVKKAKKNNIPIRIGVNAGSLEKNLAESSGLTLSEKMVQSALNHIKILENEDFDLIKVSLKASDVPTTIEAYKLISQKIPYPLHLGVTEAGTLMSGTIKSSVALGALLAEGIGDTIRVSLTENPVEEVKAGREILKALNLPLYKAGGVNFISCPSCGRCQIDLIKLAKAVEERFSRIEENITIATMGCPVNGPGEAKHADFGIAGGTGKCYIFKKGEIVKTSTPEDVLEDFAKILESHLLSF